MNNDSSQRADSDDTQQQSAGFSQSALLKAGHQRESQRLHCTRRKSTEQVVTSYLPPTVHNVHVKNILASTEHVVYDIRGLKHSFTYSEGRSHDIQPYWVLSPDCDSNGFLQVVAGVARRELVTCNQCLYVLYISLCTDWGFHVSPIPIRKIDGIKKKLLLQMKGVTHKLRPVSMLWMQITAIKQRRVVDGWDGWKTAERRRNVAGFFVLGRTKVFFKAAEINIFVPAMDLVSAYIFWSGDHWLSGGGSTSTMRKWNYLSREIKPKAQRGVRAAPPQAQHRKRLQGTTKLNIYTNKSDFYSANPHRNKPTFKRNGVFAVSVAAGCVIIKQQSGKKKNWHQTTGSGLFSDQSVSALPINLTDYFSQSKNPQTFI